MLEGEEGGLTTANDSCCGSVRHDLEKKSPYLGDPVC